MDITNDLQLKYRRPSSEDAPALISTLVILRFPPVSFHDSDILITFACLDLP
jgi:hypothetical protein